MFLGEFFSRSKNSVAVISDDKKQFSDNGISCDTAELKKAITEWCEAEGWKFKNFSDFLKLIGISTPVKLSSYNEQKKSFICTTCSNEKINISLYFWNYNPMIRISVGSETRCYGINRNDEAEIIEPKVMLIKRCINKNSNKLDSQYSFNGCKTILTLDDTHILKVEISASNMSKDIFEEFVLQSYSNIEYYLLGLDNSQISANIYKNIITLLCTPDKKISTFDIVDISYIETISEEQRIRSKILLEKGKCVEYATYKNGETFHVFKNGNWKYLSDSGSFTYNEETKNYVFSVSGSSQTLINTNISNTLKKINEKNSELRKFLK